MYCIIVGNSNYWDDGVMEVVGPFKSENITKLILETMESHQKYLVMEMKKMTPSATMSTAMVDLFNEL